MNFAWFIVTAHMPNVELDGTVTFPRGTVAHAKEMGTLRTACGLNAWSLYRVWDRQFPGIATTNCLTCVETIMRSDEVAAPTVWSRYERSRRAGVATSNTSVSAGVS